MIEERHDDATATRKNKEGYMIVTPFVILKRYFGPEY